MPRQHNRSVLKQRFALWLLGQALPDASDLEPHARSALRTVVAASLAGVMVALGVAAALAVLYLYFIKEGVAPEIALGGISLTALLVAWVAYRVAKGASREVITVNRSLELFQPTHTDALTQWCQALVGGFMEGVAEKSDLEAMMDVLEDVMDTQKDNVHHIRSRQRGERGAHR